MERHLIKFCLVLLFLQVAYLLSDLGVIPSLFPGHKIQHQQNQFIGVLDQQTNYVRRKQANSVFWQETEQNIKLYGKDTLLTLEDSSAVIRLNNDFTIHMHENTLIELDTETQGNDLSFTFTKGFINTNSKSANTTIKNNNWRIKAKKGTSLHLHNYGDDKLELEVESGHVELSNKNNSETKVITDSEKIEINSDDIISTKKISQDLSWKETDKIVYTHNYPVIKELSWSGDATKLIVKKVGSSEEDSFNVLNETSHSISLMHGTYLFNLENKNQVSKTKHITIVDAPKIQYLSPMPRDRFTQENNLMFSWLAVPEATSYTLEISNDRSFEKIKSFKTNNTNLNIAIENSGRFFWRVQAADKEDIIIPHFYYNEYFILKNPLSAPEIVKPKLRSPASGKEQDTSFFNWLIKQIIPIAHAEETSSIVFRWKKVEKATKYIIEVSDDPSFTTNLKTFETKTNDYIWENYESGKYYWRVAAENKNQMGLFSKVQEFDTGKLEPLLDKKEGVGLVKPTVVAKPKEPEVKKPEPKEPTKDEPTPWTFSAGKSIQYFSFENNDNRNVSYFGFSNIDLSISKPVNYRWPLQLTLEYSHSSWKPDNLPFQDKLHRERLNFKAIKDPTKQTSWGVFLKSVQLPGEFQFEEFALKRYLQIGAELNYKIKFTNFNRALIGKIGFADGLQNYSGAYKEERPLLIKSYPFVWGYNVEFDVYSGSQIKSAFELNALFYLKYDW